MVQAVIAGATTLFSSVGTAFGVTGAGAATAGAGIIGSVVSGVSAISAANYQAAVARRAALVHEDNAQRVRLAGQKEAQLQDEAAAAFIADDIAAQGASGFALSSPSFVRRRDKQALLAQRDRSNIVEDSIVQAQSERNQSAAALSEARQFKTGALFSAFKLPLDIYDSMIGGANLTSDIKSRRLATRATYIGAGYA